VIASKSPLVRGRRRVDSAGFASTEALVGAALALAIVASALGLVRGMMRAVQDLTVETRDAHAARWVLDRIAREAERAGQGVDPGADPGCPDEAVELVTDSAIGLRGDLDADRPSSSRDPEAWLAGRFPIVPTGNDEVVLYLRRTKSGGGSGRALFEADLDAPDRVLLGDGTLVARRDGLVETVDAGPHAPVGYTGRGTLYRVTFVHDALKFGSGRFRVVQPLLDDVTGFEVRALDAMGIEIPPCGGLDDPAAVECRASIRRLSLTVRTASGASATREVTLPVRRVEPWEQE